MYEVIYTSTAAQPMTVTALADLLREARSKNERLGITGMLLYKKASFLQVIEGAEEDVLGLYETIEADDRHSDVITLSSEPLSDGRNFPDWQMGFKHFGDVFPDDLNESYSPFMNSGFDADAFTAQSSFARDTLLHFKDTELT